MFSDIKLYVMTFGLASLEAYRYHNPKLISALSLQIVFEFIWKWISISIFWSEGAVRTKEMCTGEYRPYIPGISTVRLNLNGLDNLYVWNLKQMCVCVRQFGTDVYQRHMSSNWVLKFIWSFTHDVYIHTSGLHVSQQATEAIEMNEWNGMNEMPR